MMTAIRFFWPGGQHISLSCFQSLSTRDQLSATLNKKHITRLRQQVHSTWQEVVSGTCGGRQDPAAQKHHQGCGFAFIFCGSGSGSFSQCRSGSRKENECGSGSTAPNTTQTDLRFVRYGCFLLQWESIFCNEQ